MGHLRSNRAVRWFAPVALVGAVGLVACGDSSTDADVSARTVAPAEVVGSDVHLANQAAEIAERTQLSGSDVHLMNQAAEIAAGQSDVSSGTDVYLANRAAEIAERDAHLAGNAQTHATPDDTSDATDDEFVPGSRRMPTR